MSRARTLTGVERKRPFDPTRKFVRVRELRADRFVEFDFAIGDPDVYVEMILSADAFDDFCAMNEVTFLTDDAEPVAPLEFRLSRSSRHGAK